MITMAYVGPGLALGPLGAFLGLIVSLMMALIGAVWYPLRRIWRRAQRRGLPPGEEAQGKEPKAEGGKPDA